MEIIFGGLGALGALALIAASWIVMRAASSTKAAEIWREEAEAQKARADRLEAALHALEERVNRLEIENRRLADLATGIDKATAIEMHREVMAAINSLHVSK